LFELSPREFRIIICVDDFSAEFTIKLYRILRP